VVEQTTATPTPAVQPVIMPVEQLVEPGEDESPMANLLRCGLSRPAALAAIAEQTRKW